MIKEDMIPKIGEFLNDEFLKPLKISQNKLAKAINVPQNRISNIINNKLNITVDTDLRLCKFFNLSEGYFLRIQETFEALRVKVKIKDELEDITPYEFEDNNSFIIDNKPTRAYSCKKR